MDRAERPGAQAVQRWGATAPGSVVVLAVHGRGHNPDVMKEYSSRFGIDGLSFVAPHAPGGSWYPEPFLRPLALNLAGLQAGLDVVDECLERLVAEGFPVESIVLWGFSQGACLLSHHLLTRGSGVGGAVLFTGGFVGEEPLEVAAGVDLSGLPVIVRTVANDPFVPGWRVAQTASLLQSAGAEVDFRIDPGTEHVITDEAFSTATGLLRALRGRLRSPNVVPETP